MNTRGEVQNFVGVYPSQHGDEQTKGSLKPFSISSWDTELRHYFKDTDHKNSMLQEFANFHPIVRRTVQYVSVMHVLTLISNPEPRKATQVNRWPFSTHDPLLKWSEGKIVLIGDAAHPLGLP